MNIQNENQLKYAFATGVNLFIGAGFSILAHDENYNSLPLGSELTVELSKRFLNKESTKLNLSQISTKIKSEHRDDFYDYLKCRFTVGQFDLRYHAIKKVNIKNIFSTNIDDLIEKIYLNDEKMYINPVFTNGPAIEKQKIDLYSLHGSINNIESVKFDVFEINNSFNIEQSKWSSLIHELTVYPTVFIGYSFSDANTIQAFKSAIETKNLKQSWILVLENDTDIDSYYNSIGLDIIYGSTEEFLDYLQKNNFQYDTHPLSLEADLREYRIPEKTSIASRDFENYILGSEPTWSDIYNPNLVKLSQYKEILDQIIANKNVVIIGSPFCGKSTLLMQLAASYTFKRRLFINQISKEKADFISSKIISPIAIFLDNSSTDVEVLSVFYSNNNIQLIMAEREINYESTSHRYKNCVVIPIRDLLDSDVQKIFYSIPATSRMQKIVFRGEQRYYEKRSTFEIIQYNVNKKSFKERVNELLQKLKSTENELLLLTLICFMQKNNSLLTMDILIKIFLNFDDAFDYYDIKKKLQVLRSMIIEIGIDHELVKENQDHFSSRSRLFAEEIINQVSNDILKKVIYIVKENYLTHYIPNFKVFKRTAFDSEFIFKILPKYEEGKAFYDEIYESDKTPYILQHCALYLSKLKHSREAFEYIERAKNITRYENWTIKNTHSILLFNSNIYNEKTDGVITSLCFLFNSE